MRNSEHILRTLDSQLDEPLSIQLHLLGGAALDLVFQIPRFSEDVDLMCTLVEGHAFDNPTLQAALERTNDLLEPDGLYLTHIFDESGLVHTRDWVERLVPPAGRGSSLPALQIRRRFRRGHHFIKNHPFGRQGLDGHQSAYGRSQYYERDNRLAREKRLGPSLLARSLGRCIAALDGGRGTRAAEIDEVQSHAPILCLRA